MASNTKTAGAGLQLIFIAELMIILGSVLMGLVLVAPALSLIGLIAIVLAFGFALVGLSIASTENKGFKIAFIFTMINIAVSIALFFINNTSIVYAILSIVSTVLSILTTIFIIKTAISLKGIKETGTEKLGKVTMILYAIVNISSALIILLGSLNVFAIPLLITIVTFLPIVVYVLYVVFLGKASSALK